MKILVVWRSIEKKVFEENQLSLRHVIWEKKSFGPYQTKKEEEDHEGEKEEEGDEDNDDDKDEEEKEE